MPTTVTATVGTGALNLYLYDNPLHQSIQYHPISVCINVDMSSLKTSRTALIFHPLHNWREREKKKKKTDVEIKGSVQAVHTADPASSSWVQCLGF